MPTITLGTITVGTVTRTVAGITTRRPIA